MKNKKQQTKRFSVYSFLIIGLIVFWLAIGIFLLFNKTPTSIYVYPENPKQGDTVFIRVKSQAGEVAGNFGQQKLIFYKKGNSQEWISFLGIDADQKPGNYKIFVDTSLAEHLTNEIKVSLASFTNAPAVAVSIPKQSIITNEKAVSNIRNNDNPAISKVISKFTATPYFIEPFSSPLGLMEKSGFSFGQFIGLGATKMQHLGIDLQAAEKTDIYAVNDGKVVATLNLSNYGKTVIIDHGLDIFSLYLHLDEFNVFVGSRVRRGELIGLSGDTGYVSGPHLHFSMRVDGARVDPVEFIQITQKINDNLILADISNAFLNLINQK
ncbi:MAG: M23 family metallopeptidase [Candidatus Staskawiczbacteria bacterium]|jgi:murein DD-endopeptidase MepM/ murein hydrolase activator NlpD